MREVRLPRLIIWLVAGLGVTAVTALLGAIAEDPSFEWGFSGAFGLLLILLLVAYGVAASLLLVTSIIFPKVAPAPWSFTILGPLSFAAGYARLSLLEDVPWGVAVAAVGALSFLFVVAAHFLLRRFTKMGVGAG